MIKFEILITFLIVLLSVSTLLFISVIFIKQRQAYREKKVNAIVKKITPIVEKLFAAEKADLSKKHGEDLKELADLLEVNASHQTFELDTLFTAETAVFFTDHDEGVKKLAALLKGKVSLQAFEDVLLKIIEDAEGEAKMKAITIAYYFGFPDSCHSLLRSNLSSNVAIGCYKAGLYQNEDAVPAILRALEILSSETQLQALMALARMGNSSVMIEAFNKINSYIFINERAIKEILRVFSGNRVELFGRVIHHQSDYLVHIFLKAIDNETAEQIIEDIIWILQTGRKETRLAGLTAIGRSGRAELISILTNALNDDEWETRAMAAKMLGTLTGPEAIAPLMNAVHDREWWVRQNAVTSILAYPNYEEIMISIAHTADKYAYESIQYTIEKANKMELLSRITEIWLKDNKIAGPIESMA